MELKATQENVVEKLKTIDTFSTETREYYHFKSKLWKAIRKHIESKECVILRKRTDARFAYYRGSSAVKLNSVKYREYFNVGKPPTIYLEFKLEIDYCFDPINHFEPDHSADQVEPYSFCIDPDLETNFSEEAFEAWVREQARELKETKEKKLEYFVLDLLRAFGEDAKGFLQDPQKIEKILKRAEKREKEQWQ